MECAILVKTTAKAWQKRQSACASQDTFGEKEAHAQRVAPGRMPQKMRASRALMLCPPLQALRYAHATQDSEGLTLPHVPLAQKTTSAQDLTRRQRVQSTARPWLLPAPAPIAFVMQDISRMTANAWYAGRDSIVPEGRVFCVLKTAHHMLLVHKQRTVHALSALWRLESIYERCM